MQLSWQLHFNYIVITNISMWIVLQIFPFVSIFRFNPKEGITRCLFYYMPCELFWLQQKNNNNRLPLLCLQYLRPFRTQYLFNPNKVFIPTVCDQHVWGVEGVGHSEIQNQSLRQFSLPRSFTCRYRLITEEVAEQRRFAFPAHCLHRMPVQKKP